MTRSQARHGTQTGERGLSGLQTYQYVGGVHGTKRFLIVQCKQEAEEGSDNQFTKRQKTDDGKGSSPTAEPGDETDKIFCQQ